MRGSEFTQGKNERGHLGFEFCCFFLLTTNVSRSLAEQAPLTPKIRPPRTHPRPGLYRPLQNLPLATLIIRPSLPTGRQRYPHNRLRGPEIRIQTPHLTRNPQFFPGSQSNRPIRLPKRPRTSGLIRLSFLETDVSGKHCCHEHLESRGR